MNENWRVLTLGEVAEIYGGGTPSTAIEEYFNGDIPWITPKDLSNYPYRYIKKGNRNLSQRGLETSNAKIVPKGSVLLTTRAPVGYLAIAANPVSTNQGMHSLVPKEGFSGEFLYYLLKAHVDFLQNNASGTTFGELSGNRLKEMTFRFPCFQIQQAIANVLGTLDDKIELNRRMNKTLEQMARAIFKSWFVDFEPVRAKVSGRWKKGESLPGLSAHLWDLFPDRLIPSALGQIPEGWDIVRLGDVSDLNWGDTNVTKKSYVRDGYTAFSAKGPDGFLPYYDYDGTGVVLSAIGENSGLTWLAQGKWSCIKNTMRFWSIDESLPTEYLFYATCNKLFWPLRGSAQPFISQQDARNTLIMRPIGPLGKLFGNIIEPFHKISFYVSAESNLLTSLRDILLPRLISGKIHISTISNI